MADVDVRPRRTRRIYLLVPGAFLVGGALAYSRHQHQLAVDSAKNYAVTYTIPGGWKNAPHGPETIFREIDPKTGLVLRGAVNQVIDPNNPTPDLTTNNIAKYYEDRTDQNMPNWTATNLGDEPGDNTEFAVLRRATKDRVVVTAYAVKGNTTVLMTLFGRGKAKNLVDPNIPVLYGLLKTVKLREQDMSNL